jgi:hypothetical protein
MSESAVVHACIQWLYLHGCDVIRNNTAAFKSTYRRKDGTIGVSWVRTGKKGSGDILACSPHGKWIEVEAKSQDGKLSEHQVRRQQEIESRSGIYIIARSTDDLELRKAEIVGPR